eukprot:1134957-Rhodomonas_salina.1
MEADSGWYNALRMGTPESELRKLIQSSGLQFTQNRTSCTLHAGLQQPARTSEPRDTATIQDQNKRFGRLVRSTIQGRRHL